MNNKVSNIQMGMLLSLVICGFFLGMSDVILLRKASNEILISMPIGGLIGLVPMLMYLKINNTYPNLNIYEKVNKLFGKVLGMIINILISISYFLIFAISIRTIVIFATSKYLEVTPYILVGIFIVICCFIAVFNKLETMLRLTQVAFIVTVIIALLIETTVTPYVDIYNILPIFKNNYISNIIYGSLYYAASSSFLSVLLLSINKNSIQNNKNYNKTAIIFYLYAVLSLTLVMFFIIACFGYNMSSMFRYPEYMVLKKIGFSSSELHLENLLAFRWTFYSLALACISLYGILTGINTYKIKKPKIVIAIIAFISMFLGKKVLGSIPDSLILIKKYYIPFMAIPMFILLSIIFIRCLYIKKESN